MIKLLCFRKIIPFLLLTGLVSNTAGAFYWDDKEESTRVMSRYSAVHDYLMNLSMIEGIQVAAKYHLSKFATFSVGNLFLNREGEKIPGERLEKSYSEDMKEEHDINRSLILKDLMIVVIFCRKL
ncbi:MAG: hypothetical protein ACQEUN_16310 [Pseudomonadota bacterium]